MQQLPLVSVELRRVSAGYESAAWELGAARRVVADAGPTLGTPSCDPVVETALRDLESVLARLETTATSCARALSRYDDGAGA